MRRSPTITTRSTHRRRCSIVNCDNPFLSRAQASFLCGANAGKAGSYGNLYAVTVFRDAFVRNNYYNETTWRGSVNASGTLVDKVRFRASYQRTKRDQAFGADNIYNFNAAAPKLQRVLDVRFVNGVPTCVSKINGTDPNCVPADIFGGITSPEVFEYLSDRGDSITNSTQQVANIAMSGSLQPYGIVSPFATTGVGFALIGEWRKDTVISEGYAGYSTFTKYRGNISVKEFGGELNVPLIQDKRFVRDLTVNGGFRLSNYAGYSKVVNSWKADISYAPVDGLRFRASYNRAIRVPVKERLEATNLIPNTFFPDFCAPAGRLTAAQIAAGSKTPARYTFEQCARGGVTRQQYDALTSYVSCNGSGFCPATLVNGGNPDLLPERSRSITAGIIVQPRFLPGFMASADFYDINIFEALSGAAPGLVFEYCYDKNIQLFCDKYRRDPATGVLLSVDNRYVNSGLVRNRGIDFNVSQRIDTDWRVFGKPVGGFTIGFVGNSVLKRTQQLGLGAPDTTCVGYFGFNCPVTPAWRHNLNVVWRIPGKEAARLSFNWRHTAGTKAAYFSDNPIQQIQPNQFDSAKFPLLTHLPAGNYFDMAFKVDLSKAVTVRLNVQNLLDRDPPLAAQGSFATGVDGRFNTYPQYYEPLGRMIRFGITMR